MLGGCRRALGSASAPRRRRGRGGRARRATTDTCCFRRSSGPGRWSCSRTREAGFASFRGRIEDFVHEGAAGSQAPYELGQPERGLRGRGAASFVARVLEPGSAFLETSGRSRGALAFAGMLTGLARTVSSARCPACRTSIRAPSSGTCRLVDPDNRRPVDYGARIRALDSNESVGSLLAHWRDGRIKQRVLATVLGDRAAAPGLYASGDYQPLRPRGAQARSVIAFSRRRRRAPGRRRAAPRLGPGAGRRAAARGGGLGDTQLPVPAGRWRDVITGTDRNVGPDPTAIAELFADLPISVLRANS